MRKCMSEVKNCQTCMPARYSPENEIPRYVVNIFLARGITLALIVMIDVVLYPTVRGQQKLSLSVYVFLPDISCSFVLQP